MSCDSPSTLLAALDFRLSELLRYDFAAGAVAGCLAAWASVAAPEGIADARPVAAGLVGAVVAAVAIQAAFLDQAFLRKLRLINREPIRYLAAALFTAALGVVASLTLLAGTVLARTAPVWLRAALDGLSGLTVVWMLVGFVGLQQDAALLPDDVTDAEAAPAGTRSRSS